MNIFLKETGEFDEGNWYCSESCIPSTEEKQREEKRKLQQIEDYQTEKPFPDKMARVNEDGDVEEEKEDAEDATTDVDLDFSDLTDPKKTILTLEELERKYKTVNENS